MEEKQSTKDPRRKETVYTYLRNQIGHIQPNTDGQSVRTDIGLRLEGLIKIVKAAISEKF